MAGSPPIVSPLTVTSGRTGGRYILEVQGSDFFVPDPPPASGPVPTPPPSVRVYFGSPDEWVEAERVDVLSSELLHVLVPSHDPGVVSLRVDNVNPDGTVSIGCSVVVQDAFEFKRPMLSGEVRTAERILARVVRALRQMFVREVLENVLITIHTDFDDAPQDGLNTVEVAKMPSLLLIGPNLATNRFYSSNVPRQVETNTGFHTLRPARTVDLNFNLVGLSEFKQEILNFSQEVAAFFERNPYLYVLRDPADPSLGRVRYELALTGDLETAGSPSDSNVRQFNTSCVIRGVDLDDENMVVRQTTPIEEVVLNPEDAVPGTGAGGDVLTGDGTTDPVTGGPTPWPVYLDPAIYQLALDTEE